MTYATEFTRPSSGRARVVVLAAGLVGQVLFTLAFGHDGFSKGITLLTAALGLLAWCGPMLACRATWYRPFAVIWVVVCGFLGVWFLLFTFIVLLATLLSIATRRPEPGALRPLGLVAGGVVIVVLTYAVVIVPSRPPPLLVCLDVPDEHAAAVFEVAMPDGDADVFDIYSAGQGSGSVTIEFDDWATDGEIDTLAEAVRGLPGVTGTSREGCPVG
jgi:hypothetical protein